MFSTYSSSTAQNYGWNFCFIPKYHAAHHNGSGVVCNIWNSTGNACGVKYLYVYDTQIVGHTNNDESSTTMSGSNVIRANTSFVMRYVIGV